MRALLIEWEPHTGKRAGNINPKDPKLRCNAWQNMDVTPAVELRVVEDNRDLTQYKGVNGITVLNSKDEINAMIDKNFPSRFSIEDELLYSEHVKEEMADKTIKIKNLPVNREKRLKELKEKYNIIGIRETKPPKV